MTRIALTWRLAADIVENTTLPQVAQQADNLVLWLGDTRNPGGPEYVDGREAAARIGALSRDGFAFIAKSLMDERLIDGNLIPGGEGSFTLTFAGWQRYEQLKRGRVDSRGAFMVMPFGDAKLDRVFNECLKPAVAATGFTLVRLDEQPRAGIIDDQLRNDIRLSRFLIVELTSNNCNAYWEAGYGEGLGKPVIYTCDRAFFEKLPPYEKDGGTKFDTNHLTTVLWEETKLDDAAERLKATIRVTLPAEAKLAD